MTSSGFESGPLPTESCKAMLSVRMWRSESTVGSQTPSLGAGRARTALRIKVDGMRDA